MIELKELKVKSIGNILMDDNKGVRLAVAVEEETNEEVLVIQRLEGNVWRTVQGYFLEDGFDEKAMWQRYDAEVQK